jgi:DUF971 family protein
VDGRLQGREHANRRTEVTDGHRGREEEGIVPRSQRRDLLFLAFADPPTRFPSPRLFPFATMARINPVQLGLENMTVIGNELALRWKDGIESYFPLEFLRKRCPCAVCAGEKDILGNVYGGQVKLGPESLRLKRCTAVGGYAIQPEWMDGHSSGIYSFSYLRSLDPNVA